MVHNSYIGTLFPYIGARQLSNIMYLHLSHLGLDCDLCMLCKGVRLLPTPTLMWVWATLALGLGMQELESSLSTYLLFGEVGWRMCMVKTRNVGVSCFPPPSQLLASIFELVWALLSFPSAINQ